MGSLRGILGRSLSGDYNAKRSAEQTLGEISVTLHALRAARDLSVE